MCCVKYLLNISILQGTSLALKKRYSGRNELFPKRRLRRGIYKRSSLTWKRFESILHMTV